MRRVGIAGLVLIGLAGHARADDGAAEALRRFGLEGVWAPDCSRPPSPGNPRVVWDGPAHSITSDMQAFSTPDTITDAVRLGEGLLQFSMGRGIAPSLVVTVERTGRRVRTLSSVGVDGREYYAAGAEVATGTPSVSYERCGDAGPGS